MKKGKEGIFRSFPSYLRYFKKINARNINHMAVLDFLKMS